MVERAGDPELGSCQARVILHPGQRGSGECEGRRRGVGGEKRKLDDQEKQQEKVRIEREGIEEQGEGAGAQEQEQEQQR